MCVFILVSRSIFRCIASEEKQFSGILLEYKHEYGSATKIAYVECLNPFFSR